jgi:hypothetical protein
VTVVVPFRSRIQEIPGRSRLRGRRVFDPDLPVVRQPVEGALAVGRQLDGSTPGVHPAVGPHLLAPVKRLLQCGWRTLGCRRADVQTRGVDGDRRGAIVVADPPVVGLGVGVDTELRDELGLKGRLHEGLDRVLTGINRSTVPVEAVPLNGVFACVLLLGPQQRPQEAAICVVDSGRHSPRLRHLVRVRYDAIVTTR